MSDQRLIASCWTHAGDAAPRRPDERSPLPLLDRIAAVGAGGWYGLGLVHADLVWARDTIGYPAVRKAITEAGLKHLEVEFLSDWWTTGAEREASDAVRADLLEAVDGLGAVTIKAAGKMFGDDVDLDLMATAFDSLATEVGAHGARVALEALPFSNFSTVGSAATFLSQIGNPYGGLAIDIWHVYRGGNTPDDLLDVVDPELLFLVELNDALEPAPPFDQLWDDTVNERRLPGHGDWDVPRFINVIRQLGFNGPWGVEILSAQHRDKSLTEEVTTAMAATLSVFDIADERR